MSSSESDVSRRILVVEDERIVALDLQGALEQFGHTVRTAASSEDAIRIAAQFSPQLALMDIRLRGPVDGIDTAALLRARHSVAIVYMTANTDAATLERALETNPGGYLAKPYNTRDLRSTIAVAIKQHESDLALRRLRADLELRKAALEQQSQELEVLVEKLREESVIDPLTGIYNRRQFDSVVMRELSLAKRETRSIGFVMIDLDHFKAFNDRFGHATGDHVLREVAGFLRRQLRAHDSACRYGGEEFVLVLPGASLADTHRLAERLRTGVEQLALEDGGRTLPPVTASFGVSAFPDDGATQEDLIRVADAALYLAKQNGRNRTAQAPSRPPRAATQP